MAFWIFKYNSEKYNFDERQSDPSPLISWTVSRYREEISSGDTVFIWEAGKQRGIRAVLRVDEAPKDMPELESEQKYWREPDQSIRPRILGTITHRNVDLSAEFLHEMTDLEDLSVFHGFQQATNFPVTAKEGRILMELVEKGENPRKTEPPNEFNPKGNDSADKAPIFEIGCTYNRRADIHRLYGGQQQGGISTPSRVPCIFLFTGDSGLQHGYRDGWDEDGVFIYTGEGQSGNMQFVRGNLAVRDHIKNGKDLHLFESLGKGEGCRYLGLFDCVGWEHRAAQDTSGNPRQAIVFQLVPEDESASMESEFQDQKQGPPISLEDLRSRAIAAVLPAEERSPREARRLYRERSTAVRDYVLARANGLCEACRRHAPFSRADGTPYLEPHHTRRIADGGPDHPLWVGAICPNCHKEVHHGEKGKEVNGRLEEYLHSIELDEDI